MRYFLLLLFITPLFFQSLRAQEGSMVLTGTVKNQDGNPISHAQIQLQSYGTYTGETDEEGKYTLHVQKVGWRCVVDVTADGYPSLQNYQLICETEESTIVRDFTLYNKIKYQANIPATIILPVCPDASAGKYYRMDNIPSIFKIVFKREPAPQANVPYIVIPERDFEIKVTDYDLTLEPGKDEVIGKETQTERPFALFAGSYSTLDTEDCKEREDFLLLDTSPDCYPSENSVGVVVGAFHAYFKLRDMAEEPEIIFSDEPNGIKYHLNEKQESSLITFDLQGQRLESAPRKGVYIQNGKKVVMK